MIITRARHQNEWCTYSSNHWFIMWFIITQRDRDAETRTVVIVSATSLACTERSKREPTSKHSQSPVELINGTVAFLFLFCATVTTASHPCKHRHPYVLASRHYPLNVRVRAARVTHATYGTDGRYNGHARFRAWNPDRRVRVSYGINVDDPVVETRTDVINRILREPNQLSLHPILFLSRTHETSRRTTCYCGTVWTMQVVGYIWNNDFPRVTVFLVWRAAIQFADSRPVG